MKKEDAIKNSSKIIMVSWCSNEDDAGKYATTINGKSDEEANELINGYVDGGWPEKGFHIALVREDTILTILKEC